MIFCFPFIPLSTSSSQQQLHHLLYVHIYGKGIAYVDVVNSFFSNFRFFNSAIHLVSHPSTRYINNTLFSTHTKYIYIYRILCIYKYILLSYVFLYKHHTPTQHIINTQLNYIYDVYTT